MSNSKHKAVILYPYKFKKFDIDRYEINYLKKHFDLEIHVFNKLLYPKFNSAHLHNYAKDRKIKNFNYFDDWLKVINKIKKKYTKNIIVLNFLDTDSFQVFKILSTLKNLNIKRVDFYNQGIPNYSHERHLTSFLENYFFKLKQLFMRTKFLYGNLKSMCKQAFYNKILNFFYEIKPEYIFVAGKKYASKFTKNEFLIRGSSWDYSRYLRDRKNEKISKLNFDYAVFLANPGPKYPTDSHRYGTKITETSKNWYRALDNFFNKLEKKYNLKVIIAPHPKSKFEKKISYLGNRKAYKDSTKNLVKYSKCVITQESTALSYATIYKKPIFFIYSNETKKNPSLFKSNKFLHKLLGGQLINLDSFSRKDIAISNKFNLSKKYNYYIKNYLTSRYDKKANFEAIKDLIRKI